MDNLNDDALLNLAKVAEQIEQYEDMVEYIKEYTLRKKTLNDEDRNLLSVAFKNVAGARRSAWRIISSIESKLQRDPNPEQLASLDVLAQYGATIEAELIDKCSEVLHLVDSCLLPNAGDEPEPKVFYQKMKGDYYRYLAEIGKAKRDEYTDSSEKAYKEALDSASILTSTHPIKLGLALNVSVFYYEIMSKPDKACKLAKEAFDAAIAELDNLKEDSYKDSTLIMQLLRDNLTLWTSDNDKAEEDDN